MDYLCELPNDAARRKALESLPPDLNKTYERILERVNQSNETVQRLVRRTLQWIVCSYERLSTAQLCEAIAVEEGYTNLDKEAICGEDEILLRCSSLLRKSADANYLELAHFTVKEFLIGIDPYARYPLGMYSLPQNNVRRLLARTCLTYLNLLDFQADMPDDLESWKRQCDQYPFRVHAASHWFEYAKKGFDDPSLLALAKDLFNPSKTLNFLSWVRDHALFHIARRNELDEDDFVEMTTSFCTQGATPLHIAAALGSVELCEWLITLGCDASQMSRLGNPLHCAIFGIFNLVREVEGICDFEKHGFAMMYVGEVSIGVLQMLIDAGADCKAHYRQQNGRSLSCLEMALYVDVRSGVEYRLRALFIAGAPVNKQFLTALAALVENWDRELLRGFVDALLESRMEHELKEDLLKLGLDLQSTEVLNQLQKDRGNVLDLTSIEELEDLFRRAARFDQRAVMEELLLGNRLDPNTASSYSEETALHVAAENGSASAIELLLSLDAGVCGVDRKKQTPLHRCANSTSVRCISLLLDRSADVGAVDDEGCTIWHLAAGLGNVVS
jgi:ankyrin repeat protein